MNTRWTINITPAERDARVVLGSLAALAGGALLFTAASTLGMMHDRSSVAE